MMLGANQSLPPPVASSPPPQLSPIAYAAAPAARRAASPTARRHGSNFSPAGGVSVGSIHALEGVEHTMEEEDKIGHHHPLVMLTKTHTGAVAKLQTVGERSARHP